MLDAGKVDRVAEVVRAHWPEQIDPGDIGNPALAGSVRAARAALLAMLDLPELA
jgi:succinylarginine dihydrolase